MQASCEGSGKTVRAFTLACLSLGWSHMRISQVPGSNNPVCRILLWCIADTLHAVLFIMVVSLSAFFVHN